jgi:hypothetical protein
MARRKKATLEARHPKSRASRFMLIQAKVRSASDFFGPTKLAASTVLTVVTYHVPAVALCAANSVPDRRRRWMI